MYGVLPYISSSRFSCPAKLGRHRIDSFPRLFFRGFSKADTWATAVLVDELDAGAGQDVLEQRERSRISCVATDLDVRDGIPMKTCCRG
jgi:hypothetical protein